jgi:hypothetical protein
MAIGGGDDVAAAALTEEQMVARIFGALDTTGSGFLKLEHFQQLKPGFDGATFATVVGMVGGDASQGVSLAGLTSIYLELQLSDIRADYTALTGVTLAPKVAAAAASPEPPHEDPQAIPYDSLGWHPDLPVSYDSPEVRALRALLRREAGMVSDEHGVQRPLEIVDPALPGYAHRAAALLRRDGHVVVRDVLDAARLATVRAGVERVVREVVARDPGRLGNRGSHRYSFGPAAEAFGEQASWAALVDPPVLMEVLAAAFETDAFLCGGAGGGDFVLPGALDFQHLHSDGAAAQSGHYKDVKLGTRADGSTFHCDLRCAGRCADSSLSRGRVD